MTSESESGDEGKVVGIMSKEKTQTEGSKGIGFIRTLSNVLSRLGLSNKLGMQFGGQRDLYNVFGYKQIVTDTDFLNKYIRQDICSRIIDAPPGATWSQPPTMIDADQELIDKWEGIAKTAEIWQALYQADRLSRLGRYAILFLGFNDAGKLDKPASKTSVRELLYVRAYGSRLIDEIILNSDTQDKRFSLPVTYRVIFDDPNKKFIAGSNVTVKGVNNIKVHWSRVIHVVDNPLEDQIFSTPIIEKVYNLLEDLLKVVGGTSEVYWLTANRGMQANIDKDMDIDPKDAQDLADEIEEYQHQLRRFIRTRGVELKVLESTTPKPDETFRMLLALLSGTTGIPQRILLGSEAGQLASEQDRANWAERIDERRILFAEPTLLNPLVRNLQSVGLLKEGDFGWEWPSAFRMSPLESSMVMAQTARAIGNISRQTGNKVPMQLTSRTEGREIINLDGDLPDNELLGSEDDDSSANGGRLTPDNRQPASEEDDDDSTETR